MLFPIEHPVKAQWTRRTLDRIGRQMNCVPVMQGTSLREKVTVAIRAARYIIRRPLDQMIFKNYESTEVEFAVDAFVVISCGLDKYLFTNVLFINHVSILCIRFRLTFFVFFLDVHLASALLDADTVGSNGMSAGSNFM